jgi:hypothetical protein
MATIDNLNFKVIIDDKDFNAKIKQMEEAAKKFNASMSRLLDVNKAAEQWSQKDVENNRRAWQAKVDEARAQEKINQAKMKTDGLQRKINAQIDRATRGYQSQSRILGELKGLALGYLSIHGASRILTSLVRVTGEFEMQKTTLAAMIGDLNKAEQIITRIQGLAVESPFQFKELTTYAKQLSAFSVPAEELFETTKMLADVSAGLGVGMDRIILAYGQVRSAAFLRGQEVRQFTEAGIPILNELAKQFSELEGRAVSTGEVFDKISARLVPFEMVAKVFKDMTAEGGKFYNMQEIQAETLRGKISNLKDAYEIMLNEIGSGQTEKMKDVVDWARKLMTNYEETGRTLASLVVSYGVYKTTLVAIELITRSFSVANHKLLSSLKSIGTWMLSNPYALLAAGITAAGLATYRLATHMSDVERIQKSVADSHEDYTKALAGEYSMLESLYAKLELYTEGTLEHDKAKAQIMQKYAPYIEQLRQEGKEVSDLADIYVDLADKIRESIQVRFYDSAMQDLDQVYKDAQEKSQKMLENSIKANQKEYKFTEKDKLALNLYVLGGYDQEKAFEKLSDSAKQYFDDFNVFLNKQRDNMSAAQKAYLEGIDDISNAYQTFQAEAGQTSEKLSLFAETVQKELSKFGATKENKGKFGALWADNMTEYYAYLKKIREEYEEVKQKIKDVGTTQTNNLHDLDQQKKAIEAIAKALGISLDKGEYGKGKSKAQLELESQIDLVKKLQDAYEKLLPFLNDSQMKDTLKNLFPEAKAEWLDSFDFSEVLKKLADDLDKYDEEAAKRLRASVGKDVASSLASAFKEIETYKKMLDEWFGQDFKLEGEGISFDISKIIQNLNNQYAKVDQKRLRAQELLKKAQLGDEESLKIVREVYGEEVWQKYITDGKNAIDTLANAEKESARKTAHEKIRELADNYVKERLSTENVDLTDFGDKTLKQVETLVDRMRNIRQDIVTQMDAMTLVGSVEGWSDEAKAKFAMLTEALKQLDIVIADTGEEYDKKFTDRLKDSFGAISTLAGSIQSLGDALGSAELSSFAKDLGATADLASNLIEAFEKDDVVAIIANIATTVITKVTDVISASYEHQRMLNEAAIEYRDIMLDIRRETFSGIFGTDEMALAAENQRILTESLADYADSLKAFEEDKKLRNQKFFGNRVEFKKMSVSDVVENIADASGWDLYRENGELNMDALIAYYDSYAQHLTKGQKGVVDALISSYQAQNDAAAQSAEYMKSVFSGAADSIANDMVAAFIESGDAAIDMRSIVSDVASGMAGDLIKTLYIMPTLERYAKELEAISSNDQLSADEKTAQSLGIFQTALAEIEGNSDAINETLQKLDEFFLHPEEGEDALGAGIKGMTEDTANLLASYLNAIRADVSYSKELWQKMDANTQAIANALVGFSAPTLLDYQKRIEANTYNNMLATQEILAELRSVVTSESGATSIRVYREN